MLAGDSLTLIAADKPGPYPGYLGVFNPPPSPEYPENVSFFQFPGGCASRPPNYRMVDL